MSAVVAAGEAGRAQRVAEALDRAVVSILRHERRYLFVTLAVFLLLAGYQCVITPLWFDEFLTLFIARLPSAHAMLQAIPADGQPPLQYFLTSPVLKWFGTSALALRLPELLAYVLAGLGTWHIARRHGSPVQALFAVAAVMGGIGRKLAYTARPYELLFVFTIFAYASWQAACHSRRRLPALCALSLSIAGGVLSHYFGIIHIGVFLLAGETVRFLRRRQFDWPMLGAITVGMLPLIFTEGLARQSSHLLRDAIRHSTNFWARPSPLDLLGYWQMIPVALVVGALALKYVHRPQLSDPQLDRPTPDVPSHEWAAVAGLCALLPIQIAIAYVATGYSLPRYAVSSSLGVALFAAWGLPRIGLLGPGIHRAMGIATIAYLAIVPLEAGVARFWQPADDAASPVLSSADRSLPIVVASAYDYLPDWWYSTPDLRRRLIYLSDADYAIGQPDFLPELSLDAERDVVPMPTADYAAFTAEQQHFFVVCTSATRLDWTCSRLAGDHRWRMTLIAARKSDGLFRVDRNP